MTQCELPTQKSPEKNLFSRKAFKVFNKKPGYSSIVLTCLSVVCFSDPGVCATTPHEPNNSLADATLVTVNGDPKTYKFDYKGDEDWYKFYALKGNSYDLNIPDASVDQGINPAFELLNNQGEILLTFDLHFSGKGELYSWHDVPADGYYYLRVFNQKQIGRAHV